ncbi:hypothetical protein Hypma_003639 [Hypsizygus marmoreus]|uniref:MYND-type domain-containing protein n=1 Tax=Hypsizygus marmoreus TaxID=39966 RepID=A0A369J7Q1_HYPMA|nr:hypothetical protein Hypma_003639 [Hypsizygus marmoreus]
MLSHPSSRQSTRQGKPLQIPRYEDNPIAWNAALEENAALVSAKMMSPSAPDHRLPEATEAVLSSYRNDYGQLCDLQHKLTALEVAQHVAVGFDGQWRDATANERRYHIIEGHIRAAITGFEGDRELCGDVTFASLQENNGDGFLKLLRVYMHDDLSSVPTTPITLPYNGSSGIPMPPAKNGWRAFLDTNRSLLRYTLHSWQGRPRPLPQKTLKTSSLKAELDDGFVKLAKIHYTPSEYKELRQTLRSGYVDAIRSCESCGKSESAVKKHMQCKNCMELVNRRTSYCSRQCQKDDWPRHKLLCGKKMTLEIARSSAIAPQMAIARPKIGCTVGGYKRSPALLAQVHELNLNPGIDYFLMNSSGNFTPLYLASNHARQGAFRTLRDKAMTSGDRSTVAALGEAILVFGILAASLQFQRDALEYGESIREDIRFLTLKTLHHHSDGLTQLEKQMAGQEIDSVLVSVQERERLDAYVDMLAKDICSYIMENHE